MVWSGPVQRCFKNEKGVLGQTKPMVGTIVLSLLSSTEGTVSMAVVVGILVDRALPKKVIRIKLASPTAA